MIDEKKMSKQPPSAPTASAVGPCPTDIQISRTPRHWKFTQHHRTTRPPPHCLGYLLLGIYCNFNHAVFDGLRHTCIHTSSTAKASFMFCFNAIFCYRILIVFSQFFTILTPLPDPPSPNFSTVTCNRFNHGVKKFTCI